MVTQTALRSRGRTSIRAEPSTRIKRKEEEKQIIETLEKIKEIPKGKTQVEKDWEQVQLMLSRGKVKSGFSQMSKDIYHAIQYPTSHKINNLVGKLPKVYITQMRKMRQDYRSGVSARAYYREKTAWSAPVVPKEGEAGFIGPVRPEYLPKPSDLVPSGVIKEIIEKKGFVPRDILKITTPSDLVPSGVIKEIIEKKGFVSKDILKTDTIEVKDVTTSKVDLTKETQRYKDLGYTKRQSEILAKESLDRGGMTFSPKGAEKIIESKRVSVPTNLFFTGESVLSVVSAQTLKTKEDAVRDDISVPDRIPDRDIKGMGFFSPIGDRASDFISRVREGDKETFKEQEIKATKPFISAYDPSDFKGAIEKPEKTWGEKLKDIPSNVLGYAREFSAEQRTLVGAESMLEIGGVAPIESERKEETKLFFKETGRKVGGFAKEVGEGILDFPIVVPQYIPKPPPSTAKEFFISGLDTRITKPWRVSTIGETGTDIQTGVRMTGSLAALGYTGMFSRLGVEQTYIAPPSETPIYQRATLIGEPSKQETPFMLSIPEREEKTAAGFFVKGIEVAPEMAAWIAAPYAAAGVTVLASGEKLTTLDTDAKKLAEKEWKQYERDVSSGVIQFKEGERVYTKQEFLIEILPQIREQLKKQALIEGGVSLGFLAVGGVKWLRKPVIKYRQAKAPSPWFGEVKTTISKGGKTVEVSSYELYSYRPPVERQVTTRFRNIFGMKPKFDWTPRGSLKQTPFGQTYGQLYKTQVYEGKLVKEGIQPYVAETAKYGKAGKLGKPKYSLVIPDKQVMLPREKISLLPSREQAQIAELIAYKKGTPPLKLETLPQFVKESEALYGGKMQVVNLWKGEGRRTTTSQVFSLIEKQKEIQGFKFLRADVTARDISKPFGRVTKRVSYVEGRIVELPQINLGREIEGMVIKPSVITKTPFAKTFQEQTILSVVAPKPPPSAIPKMITIPPTELGNIPLMVGGTGLATLPFGGEGVYERMEVGGGIPLVSAAQVDSVVLTPKEIEVQKPSTILISEPKLETVTKQIIRPTLKMIPQVKQIPTLKQIPVSKQIPILKQVPITKQELLPQLKQVLRTQQIQVPRQPTITKPPITPLVPKTPLLKRLSKKAEEGELFEAFAFKFGKEVKVAKGTKRKVSSELEKFLKKELSASGYLTKEGKKIKAEETGLLRSMEFRKSKISPFLVVEKKAKRLRIGGTGKEIQFFRGKKNSKKSLFGL